MNTAPAARGAGRVLLTAALTLGGAGLFAWVVRRTGVADILEGMQRVGWGLAVVLALAGLRFAIRTAAWRRCMPPGTRVSFRRALGAFLAGDALGSVTPLGLFASEPTKVLLTRHLLPTRESIASLAVENLVYAASVATIISIGLVVVLATVPLPPQWQWWIAGGLAALAAAAAAGWRLMRGVWDPARGERPAWRERMTRARLAVTGFLAAHPARLWQAFALDMAFHAVATIEIFLTLRWLLGDRSPTLVQALGFEALNRIVTVAFKFVPFRIGVDEALSGAIAPMLAVNPAAGVSLAVVRKVRNLAWAGIGLAIIGAHPATRTPGDAHATGESRSSS